MYLLVGQDQIPFLMAVGSTGKEAIVPEVKQGRVREEGRGGGKGLFFTLFWVKWGDGPAKANSPGGLSLRDRHPHRPLPRPFEGPLQCIPMVIYNCVFISLYISLKIFYVY